jgi:hypothetical protein
MSAARAKSERIAQLKPPKNTMRVSMFIKEFRVRKIVLIKLLAMLNKRNTTNIIAQVIKTKRGSSLNSFKESLMTVQEFFLPFMNMMG